jgi:CubicO group peptidase (beta-lactamase class C family)
VTIEAELAALAAEAQGRSPQLVWAVLLDGRIALHGGSTSTVFRIASMTKSFTAATVLALRDRGELRLDDEVEVLADQRPTSDSPAVTIRDVLSMGSGLPTDDAWADRHLDMDPAELDRLVRSGVAYAFPTGTAYEYSNLGYALLGDLTARTTDLLLDPLGLTSTTWTQPDHADWAPPPPPDPALGHGAFAGMGGLWSNLADLATWVTFLADAFPPRDDPDDGPLRRSSRREMQQVHRARLEGGGYGYGLQVRRDERFGTSVDHSGGLPGYGSNMRWLPGRRVGAIALANSTYAPMAALTRRMLDALDDHGLVPAAVVPVSPALRTAAEGLVALLSSWHDATADRLFTDNVVLDQPYSERAAAAAELGSLHVERIDATSATGGTIHAGGRRIELQLSPIAGGGIEHYEVVQ